MAKRRFERGQTQIFYRYLPGAIFNHDDYGLCYVDQVLIDEIGNVNKPALFDTLRDTLVQWDRESFRNKFPDPRAERNRRLYRIGQPREVLFTPFPRVLECRKCKHVVEFDKLSRRGLTVGECPRDGCDGQLQQLEYVEVHNCGRIEQMYVPAGAKGCPQHGSQYLCFFNPGRTQAARWFCGVCGRELQKARMTPCSCEYTKAVDELGRSKWEKFLRLYPTSEPGLYIPHVLAFINFPEEQEQRLVQIEDALPLLLARVWGVLETPVLTVAEERRRWGSSEQATSGMEGELVRALAAVDPNNPLLREYKEKMANPPGQQAVDTVRTLLGDAVVLNEPPTRKLVEHAALQDNMSLVDVPLVAKRLRERGAMREADKFVTAAGDKFTRLGLNNVYIVNDFPIALAALGYTRLTKDPKRSVFNPFPVGEDDRIPLFVNPTETEGLWFQLNPGCVAAWLYQNRIIEGSVVPSGHAESWAWLYRVVLKEILESPLPQSAASKAVMMLVHTMSHVFLQRIEWSGFASSSVGEYLMPGTLSFILYANRFAESKIGGLTTLFEQRLHLWLDDAAQSGRFCMYDPLCGEDGGSCAGCLHREHNCPMFNREMSRAVLYGGLLPSEGVSGCQEIKYGYWSRGIAPMVGR